MLMVMEFNYEWLLSCLIENCDYFSLIKLFHYENHNEIECDLESVEDNNLELISKWYGSKGRVGVKKDYLCNSYNYLSLLKYNGFYNFDKDTDVLFYKKNNCMFFTMHQEQICYMSDRMYDIYRNMIINGFNERKRL